MYNFVLQPAVLLFSYLLGSVPFGLILTHLAGLGDIRKIGSGNIGATNVLRTGHKKLAALTLILDAFKGAAAVIVVRLFVPDLVFYAAFAALLGHIFPVWLQFKGGKGVATAVGVLTALSWPVGLCFMGTWMLVAALTRYSSLAALMAMALSPVYAFLFGGPSPLIFVVGLMAVLVCCRHLDNIRRLFHGTESKIGAKKSEKLVSPAPAPKP